MVEDLLPELLREIRRLCHEAAYGEVSVVVERGRPRFVRVTRSLPVGWTVQMAGEADIGCLGSRLE